MDGEHDQNGETGSRPWPKSHRGSLCIFCNGHGRSLGAVEVCTSCGRAWNPLATIILNGLRPTSAKDAEFRADAGLVVATGIEGGESDEYYLVREVRLAGGRTLFPLVALRVQKGVTAQDLHAMIERVAKEVAAAGGTPHALPFIGDLFNRAASEPIELAHYGSPSPGTDLLPKTLH